MSVYLLSCIYNEAPFSPLKPLPAIHTVIPSKSSHQIWRPRKAVFPTCLGTWPGFYPLFPGPNSLMSQIFLWIPLRQVALFWAWSFPNTSWDCCGGIINSLWGGAGGCEDSGFFVLLFQERVSIASIRFPKEPSGCVSKRASWVFLCCFLPLFFFGSCARVGGAYYGCPDSQESSLISGKPTLEFF